MADTKISNLAAAAAALGTQEVPVNDAGGSKKVTVAQIAAYVLTAGLYAPGSFSIPTGGFALMVARLTLTSSQRATLVGTARLRIS